MLEQIIAELSFLNRPSRLSRYATFVVTAALIKMPDPFTAEHSSRGYPWETASQNLKDTPEHSFTPP